MKRKGFYVLATAAMLALATGCGNNQAEENPQNQITEATTPTEAPAATATPEPTATPAPTATPKPANYMEANGIEVLGAGSHICKSFILKETDANGNRIFELADYEYFFEVTEEDCEGGTKMIHVTLNVTPYVNKNGGYGVCAMGGFVDIKTGKALYVWEEPETILLKQEEKEYELQVVVETEYPSVTHPYYTNRYTLICPDDYEDAGFYLTGWDFSEEAYMSRVGGWKKLNYIQHGESDMAVFGVKKGLETEPEKKTADGKELAEENYFETNGFTTQGEGEFVWFGTEALRKWNGEVGFWESVSLKEKEITGTFSSTEESLGDGTKKITGTFTYMLEMLSETEAAVPWGFCGIADKKTGLNYPSRTYGLADSYVLEKNGENFFISIGVEVIEEDMGNGKRSSCMIFTLLCPEDYNDAVFFLTSEGEIYEDENTYLNEVEVRSLSEIEHGKYDLLFFQ